MDPTKSWSTSTTALLLHLAAASKAVAGFFFSDLFTFLSRSDGVPGVLEDFMTVVLYPDR